MLILETSVAQVLREKESNDVWTVEPKASVQEAAEFMEDKNVGSLLVVDRGRVVGILTERDCIRNVLARGRLGETRVEEVMTRRLLRVAPSTTVNQCFGILTHQRTRHLVVADESEIFGIISIGDVVRWMIDDHRFTIDQLELYVNGSYAPLFSRRRGAPESPAGRVGAAQQLSGNEVLSSVAAG